LTILRQAIECIWRRCRSQSGARVPSDNTARVQLFPDCRLRGLARSHPRISPRTRGSRSRAHTVRKSVRARSPCQYCHRSPSARGAREEAPLASSEGPAPPAGQ
jgi:hypothetical protein